MFCYLPLETLAMISSISTITYAVSSRDGPIAGICVFIWSVGCFLYLLAGVCEEKTERRNREN